MSFDTEASRSIASPVILVQMDISSLNLQWVNAGAGIWYVNFSASYPEVGAPGDDLLNGFSAQSFGDVGSLLVDTVHYVKANSVSELTTTEMSFYYDQSSGEVFVHFVNNDDPIMHHVFLGIIYGFSYDDFLPIGALNFYEGRLVEDFSVSESRDPLFFGRMLYNVSGISLVNSDGHFDSYPESKDFYGNALRVLVGFRDLDISEYVTVFSGIIEKVTLSETAFNIAVSDKRKTLSKTITYTKSTTNAMEVIRDLLATHYNAVYTDVCYDMTAWATFEALMPTISIDIGESKTTKDIKVIELIEKICSSVFGMFFVNTDNKYSFKVIDTSDPALLTIPAIDILNRHEIGYDPNEVISSAKVGYAKNWEPAGGEYYDSPFQFYNTKDDTEYELQTFLKYKVYNEKSFETLLDTIAQARDFGETMMQYAKDVHGVGSIEVPLSYHALNVGDMVNVEIEREKSDMLGTKKCEILAKSLSLRNCVYTLKYRIIN